MGRWEWCLLAIIGLTFAQGPEKRRTGNVCDVDLDCPDNAFCRQGAYCVCKDAYVFTSVNSTHKGCLIEARLGEPCEQNVQCQVTLGVHGECADGVCACEGTSHFENNRCYETALVGERCIVDQNCHLEKRGTDGEVYCVRGYCTCQLLYSPRENGTRCVRDAYLGEPCEDEQQCAGVGQECRGTCRCKENWVINNSTKTCVKAVRALNESCDLDVQCAGLAGAPPDAHAPAAVLCLGGACSCTYTAREAGQPSRCWHRRQPGQYCHRDEECYSEEDEPGFCHAGRCTCKTCIPDVKDFDGASTLSRPPVLAFVIVSIAAILMRH